METATRAPVYPQKFAGVQKAFTSSTAHSCARLDKESQEGKRSTNKAPWRDGKQRSRKKKNRQGGNHPRWFPRAHQSGIFRSHHEDNMENNNIAPSFGPATKLMDVNAPPFNPQTDVSSKIHAGFPDPEYPWAYGTPPPAMAFRIFPVSIPEETFHQATIPNAFQVVFGTQNERHNVFCWDGIPPGAQGFCYALSFASGQHFYIHPRDVSPVHQAE